MIYPPPGSFPGPYPQPQPPPRRFSTGAVVGGIAAVLPINAVILGGIGLLVGRLGGASDTIGSLSPVLFLVGWGVPVAVGIVLTARGGSPRVRGFGLGLAVGWAVWLIIGAGVCVGLIGVLSVTGFS